MKHNFPKGILIPIGGAEDKDDKMHVLKHVIEASKKTHPKICVLTVATGVPEEVADDYRKAFEGLGIKKIDIIFYTVRSEADTDEHLKIISLCDVVLFSGGDQLKLSSLLGGTALMRKIRERYNEEAHFVIAGTSAGAAAMSDTMIISGSSQDALIKGELELTNGLDLINSVFIDTHFTQRGRFGRLIQTITYNPGVLGVGLGEDTGLIIHSGNEMRVIGSGLVIVVDGTDIVYTNLTEIENGQPITVEGLKLHVLGPGERFKINERSIIKPNEKQNIKQSKSKTNKEKTII